MLKAIRPLAVMKVSAIETLSADQKQLLIEKTFGTTDPEHPGVPAFADVGDSVLSGPIEVLNYSYFREDFPDTFRTAVEIREDHCRARVEYCRGFPDA